MAPKKRLSWEEWQKKANDSYIKGEYAAQQMVADWGYPEGMSAETHKIEFDKGKVKRKDRVGRRIQRAKATKKRSQFDITSTEAAAKESKKIKQQSSNVSKQAELFGLEPTQIEHLADQADVEGLTAGAPGDPTNLLQVRQSEALYKNDIKVAVGKENAVTINPVEESLRVIPKKFFDPLADPSTLPGVDIPIGTPVEKVQKTLSQVEFKGGKAVLKALPMGVGAAATFGFGLLDVAQAAEGISSVQEATSTPEVVAGGLEAVSGGLGLAATKVPVLAAPAMVAGVTAGAIRMRMEQDVQREREQQVMAGEVSRYGPAVTETPQLTKPMSKYQLRRKARTGRY